MSVSDDPHRAVLMAAKFVESCAEVARDKFDTKLCGAFMLGHGYSLLTGASLEASDLAVRQMLLLHEAQVGRTQ